MGHARPTRLVRGVVIATCVMGSQEQSAAQQPSTQGAVVETIIRFTAEDGVALEGKLTLPEGAGASVPVIFYLHGAGPRTYDHPVRYRGADGQVRSMNYYDFCPGAGAPRRRILPDEQARLRDRLHGPAGGGSQHLLARHPTVLLQDYARGLAVLREHPGIDADRIVLYGSSEGTRLAPQLAQRAPAGIVGWC